MPLLRSIERRIEAIFEGAFGRAFRAHVQPVELARKLAKEMDDHRTASVTRVYVPNEYTVYLAPEDREQFSSYEEALCNELQDYLSEHAQRERLRPAVGAARRDRDRRRSRDRRLRDRHEDGAVWLRTSIRPRSPRLRQPRSLSAPRYPSRRPPRSYALVYPGGRFPLHGGVVALGRARECEIHLADPNVSRRHAEIRPDGGSYSIVDLGSTNGTELNGQRIKHARLSDGDVIAIGQTELTFVRE